MRTLRHCGTHDSAIGRDLDVDLHLAFYIRPAVTAGQYLIADRPEPIRGHHEI